MSASGRDLVVGGRCSSFFGFSGFRRAGKVLVGINIGNSLQQGKDRAGSAPSALGKLLPRQCEHLMRQPVLVVSCCIDACGRHLITWSEWPSRHAHFGTGNKRILVTIQFSSNGSIALIRRNIPERLAENLSQIVSGNLMGPLWRSFHLQSTQQQL